MALRELAINLPLLAMSMLSPLDTRIAFFAARLVPAIGTIVRLFPVFVNEMTSCAVTNIFFPAWMLKLFLQVIAMSSPLSTIRFPSVITFTS